MLAPIRLGTLLVLVLLCAPDTGATQQDPAALNARIDLLLKSGKLTEAIRLAQEAVSAAEQQHGLGAIEVAAPLQALAQALSLSGRLSEAEPNALRALAMVEKVLGPDHPDTKSVVRALAAL